MAVIAITPRTEAPVNLVRTTLTASDTLAYVKGAAQVVEFTNTTASPVVVAIKGAGASAAFPIPGTAGTTVDLTGGKSITVPGVIGATTAINLDALPSYMLGAVTVTNGTGLTATVLSN